MSLIQVYRALSRLKEDIQFRYDIGAPSFILSIIREGYKIPFEHNPPGIFLKNRGLH